MMLWDWLVDLDFDLVLNGYAVCSLDCMRLRPSAIGDDCCDKFARPGSFRRTYIASVNLAEGGNVNRFISFLSTQHP